MGQNSMQQARAPPEGNGSPQKDIQSLQVPQMGYGQGGKKVLTAYQLGKQQFQHLGHYWH